MGEQIIPTVDSDTYLFPAPTMEALAEVLPKDVLVLDTGEPVPPDTPAGTVIVRPV